MYNTVLPPAVRDALLEKAAGRNVPIVVMQHGDESHTNLRSRLLSIGDAGNGPLTIEMPLLSGQPVVPHPGDILQVMLVIEGQRYGFNSVVAGRGRATLSDDNVVSCVALDYPETMVKLQRRRFYRAVLSNSKPVMAKCLVRCSDEEYLKLSASERLLVTGNTLEFEAELTDISSGGVGLKVGKVFAGFAGPGARWALAFRLPGASKAIKVLIEPRHSRLIGETDRHIVGAEFVDWQKNLAGRQAMNSIMRFVARVQRDELKKISGGQ